MRWFYKIADTEHGPVSADDVEALYNNGTLSSASKLREEDSSIWKELQRTEFGREFGIYKSFVTNIDGDVIETNPDAIQPLGWRAGFLKITSLLVVGFGIVTGIGEIGLLIAAYMSGSSVTIMNDPFVLMLTIIYGYGALVTGISFILSVFAYCFFFQRAMKNVRSLGAVESTIRPRWTWGWHFIPFANLVMPFKAVSQIWDSSHRLSENNRNQSNSILLVWWFSWVSGNVITNFTERFLDDSINENFEIVAYPEAVWYFGLSSFSTLLFIISALSLYRITKKTAEMQSSFTKQSLADEF